MTSYPLGSTRDIDDVRVKIRIQEQCRSASHHLQHLTWYQLNVRIVRQHAQPAVSVWEDFVKTISSRRQRKNPPRFRTCVRVGQEARLS
jgi:hypothetical protein